MNITKVLIKVSLASTLFLSNILAVAYAQPAPVQAVDHIELSKYLGTWHEIARKPLSFQNKCDHNVSASYALNKNGNIEVTNRCYSKTGKLSQAIGEAWVQNPPANSKLKVSFLPKAIRWLPVGRGDYWVLKIDQDYQTVLVGGPSKKYMWILSRTQNPDPAVIQAYLNYAQSIGYDLGDLIQTKQPPNPMLMILPTNETEAGNRY